MNLYVSMHAHCNTTQQHNSAIILINLFGFLSVPMKNSYLVLSVGSIEAHPF
eukprot:m.151184 g.151184  ORF g.151184 m.151184 type:complete len:52 (+) comp14245_c1_seq1:1711-1866(+)